MKIAVLGIHCSGKTTLASLLAKKLDMPYISSDPIEYLKLPWRPHTFRTQARDLFLYESISLTRTIFGKYRSFVTDYDPAIQLAYCWRDPEVIAKLLSVLPRLPKYDIVIMLNIHDPITVLYRAVGRLRWGSKMLSAGWLASYYKFTMDVLEGWYKHWNHIACRGKLVISLNVDNYEDPNETLRDILNLLPKSSEISKLPHVTELPLLC